MFNPWCYIVHYMLEEFEYAYLVLLLLQLFQWCSGLCWWHAFPARTSDRYSVVYIWIIILLWPSLGFWSDGYMYSCVCEGFWLTALTGNTSNIIFLYLQKTYCVTEVRSSWSRTNSVNRGIFSSLPVVGCHFSSNGPDDCISISPWNGQWRY